MRNNIHKKHITLTCVILLLANILLSGGCKISCNEDNLTEVYNNEIKNILSHYPSLISIIKEPLPKEYPFKLFDYMDTAKKMYGKDMTIRDFAFCSITGWGVLKTFETQHPDVYKTVKEKLDQALMDWCKKNGVQYSIDDFLMMMSFWTVYFNSLKANDGSQTLRYPLFGEGFKSLDSKIGYGEMVAYLSALWISTSVDDIDMIISYFGNVSNGNSFGITKDRYKVLRHIKGNYLLSESNGWDIQNLFCSLGTGCQYFSESMYANLIKNKLYKESSFNLYFGDLVVSTGSYLHKPYSSSLGMISGMNEMYEMFIQCPAFHNIFNDWFEKRYPNDLADILFDGF